MICFEFPLTEQVRTWLRIEAAWLRWNHFASASDPNDHHAALMTLFECVDIASRGDLKRHLIATLESELTASSESADSPPQRPRRLSGAERAARVLPVIEALRHQPGRIDHQMRSQPLLNALRTRAHVSGGVCGFDLPTYHFWLNQTAEKRRADLAAWAEPFAPLTNAVACVLEQLRAQSEPQTLIAANGCYQRTLDGTLPRLVQVWVDAAHRVVPKVSANKYQFNIHFIPLTPDGGIGSETVSRDTFPFALALCY
ncbi:cell division protein ZapD [Hydrogenophilus islandicus]